MEILKSCKLESRQNLVCQQNQKKLPLENETLILFKNFGKVLITKCHDVLSQFPGISRVKLNFEAIYSHFKRCATFGTPCMMDRGVHHMMDRVHHMMDGVLHMMDTFFSTNSLYLWFLIAQELKNLNSMGAVKLFFQYLIPSPSYSCYSHLDDLGSII